VAGRPLALEVRGVGSDVVFVFATIHGNEPAGTPLARALLAHLDAHPELLEDRRVLVMPDANPDGHARGTRANARGVDLNRDFDARSEPEAAAIERVVRLYRPARILSIHQPLRCVDWDGPAASLAREVARHTDLPVKKLGTRPGSFGAWAEAHGVALVTLELPPKVERLGAEALWRRYGPALLAFVDAR
jgi:protein MpaA